MSAAKREHHNALERERRNIINVHFKGLQKAVPELQAALQQGRKPSRAATVEKTIGYIDAMRKINYEHQEDVDTLKRRNMLLEDQILKFERENAERDAVLRSMVSHVGSPDAVANFKQESESDTSDSETSYTSCMSDTSS